MKDFHVPSNQENKVEKIMCGTGPLTEEPISSDEFMVSSSIMDATFNTLRAARQLDDAIHSFKSELKDEQPVCMHPDLNCK